VAELAHALVVVQPDRSFDGIASGFATDGRSAHSRNVQAVHERQRLFVQHS
jgi:hypothetical protein